MQVSLMLVLAVVIVANVVLWGSLPAPDAIEAQGQRTK
jgi:hypothetical protein